MARVNLRAAFMSGTESTVAAQQVFTNRTNEVAAFKKSLTGLHSALDGADTSPVVDRVQGRRNVLTFYGVGGIGKTTLSQELERRLFADARAEGRNDAVSVWIDVSEDGASDIESLLLRLRAGLGQLGNRWPAFDLALASYWARAHPGEALQEFLDSVPAVRRASRSVGLSEQIAASVEHVVPADVGGLTGLAQRAAMGTYRAIRSRVREGRLLSECELFAELVEADADYETLSFFPYLLAWDLEQQLPRDGRRPKVCVFLDTFEVLGGQGDRTAEKFVQRCVYLMPNVLFVITGRNRIDWADGGSTGELDFTGAERWPLLHFRNDTAEPRQHLVGYLSDSDADSYLREALTQDGEPAMPAPVRERIISSGQGLPLYLDLSVSHFVELLARGGQPSVDDFGGSFTAVATRSIRDLPKEERDLVRTAALVDRVDADLLRAGQPSLPDGCVARFLRRPFLTHDDAYELPYALHMALRSAIHEADRRLADGWSDRDRREVAGRLLRRLGERLGPRAGRATAAQALASGLKLSGAYGVFDGWMVRVAQQLVEAGQWTDLGEGLTAGEAEVPEFRAVRAAIKGVQLRRAGRAPEAVTVLEKAGEAVPGSSPAAQLVRVHLAHALRNKGDYTQAADLYRALLDGEFEAVARYWLSDFDYLNGRFATALTALDHPGRDAADEGERLRLRGHIWRVNARFDAATDCYSRAIALAREEGLVAAEAKALANLAQTACWSSNTPAVGEAADAARRLLDLVPNPVELVKIRSAEAVAFALAGDHRTAREAVTGTRDLADSIGYRGGHNLADVADALLGTLTGDAQSARRARTALDERTRSSGGNTYWVPVVTSWTDGVAAAAEVRPTVEWVDGPAAALGRWAAVVTRR
ncbi:tetratricopeptide repeat protein [Streptomyces sp. ACA25]|uniref:tetratricopeptide repeat protein n=1 Tax=Streptomyces sp. ACA25 TaxID=3022596 RepID=UPI002307103E|nr:tetratricopeptide repeat protein [Streptomyces sp. ACA25]MDB1088713.1 tetratricopeptide repeat protein [Streptomyces sp. ACA25]